MKCVDSIRRFSLPHPPLALHLSARRDVFLVCSVASVVKERISMTHSTENTWTVAPHWLGLAALRLSEVILDARVSSTNLVCNVAIAPIGLPAPGPAPESLLPPASPAFSSLKSHPLP